LPVLQCTQSSLTSCKFCLIEHLQWVVVLHSL
jgi:hypothetical protein